jgi:hypothetical protein
MDSRACRMQGERMVGRPGGRGGLEAPAATEHGGGGALPDPSMRRGRVAMPCPPGTQALASRFAQLKGGALGGVARNAEGGVRFRPGRPSAGYAPGVAPALCRLASLAPKSYGPYSPTDLPAGTGGARPDPPSAPPTPPPARSLAVQRARERSKVRPEQGPPRNKARPGTRPAPEQGPPRNKARPGTRPAPEQGPLRNKARPGTRSAPEQGPPALPPRRHPRAPSPGSDQ